MKTFAYKGFRTSGEGASGLVEALDVKDAREKLTRRGVLPEQVEPAGASSRRKGLSRKHGQLPATERVIVYRELAALLRAGVPLDQALQILIEAPELGSAQPLLAGLKDRLHEGEGLSRALSGAGSELTPFEEAVLEAGERSGALDEAMEELATFMEEQQELHDSIQTSLIYPAMVTGLALVVAIVVLGLMVPALGRMLEEAQMQLPWVTRFMLGVGQVVSTLLLPVGLVIGLTVYVVRKQLRSRPGFRARVDALFFRLPLWRKGYRILVNLRFTRTLALLLRGGAPLLEALPLAGRSTGSLWTEQAVAREAEGLRHGEALADILRRVPSLSGSLPAWVQAGEAGGDLEGLLRSAAARYEQQWKRYVGRLMAALEPALIIVIGAFVLLVALSILLPILGLNDQLVQ